MSVFRFKQFTIIQEKSALKVGTDALLLGAMVTPIQEGRILDVGSGTGVLSLMLAQRCQDSFIDAIEQDRFAAEESSLNFKNSLWSDRLKIHHADFFNWNSVKGYDLIVSNPPFYLDGLKPEDERMAVSKHAFFDFGDFFQKSAVLLNPKGVLWMIYPSNIHKEITRCIETSEFYLSKKISVYGKPGRLNRFIIALSKAPCALIEEDFLVRDEFNTYSDQYKELTFDFHDREL